MERLGRRGHYVLMPVTMRILLLKLFIWSWPTGWAAVVFFLLTRKVDRFIPDWFPPYGLTLTHFLVFAILAVLLYVAFKSASSINMKWGLCFSFLFSSAYGTMIEWYQYHIPWRTADWNDVMANIAGAGMVFLLALADRRCCVFPRM